MASRQPAQPGGLLLRTWRSFSPRLSFRGAVSVSTVTPFDRLGTVHRHPFDVPSPVAAKLAPNVAWRAINDELCSRDNKWMRILSVALSTSSGRPPRAVSFGFSPIVVRQKIQ